MFDNVDIANKVETGNNQTVLCYRRITIGRTMTWLDAKAMAWQMLFLLWTILKRIRQETDRILIPPFLAPLLK